MSYVYVASSWRCKVQPLVVSALREIGIDCYDFRNPGEGSVGFSWRDVKGAEHIRDGESVETYLRMLGHPLALAGFKNDMDAMKRADIFVLVLPAGRSAHLELGWAVGAGKRTAILLEDPIEPELMYRMVELLTPNLTTLIEWVLDIQYPHRAVDIPLNGRVSP